MKNHIILTADDFGVNDYIDNGTIKAIEEGKINCVSTMVTHPDSGDRIEKLRSRFPGLSIGLHFSICSGSPVSGEESTLTKKENGKVVFQEANSYSFTGNKADDIEIELVRQLDKLKEILSCTYNEIDHVNEHFNLCDFELKYFRRKAKILGAHSIPTRSLNQWSKSIHWVDDNDNRRAELAPIILAGLRMNILDIDMIADKRREKIASRNGLQYLDFLCDVIYGQASEDHFNFLFNHFVKHDDDDDDDEKFFMEFMFHLGEDQGLSEEEILDCQATHGIDPEYFDERKTELDTLSHFDINAALESRGIQKCAYRDLL
ncbi:ChbG/HpnK family deacetylase [Crocinitomix catalasitica]|nr:ChbG/HpnK family deacetylase [Crocinitomix catalasitica]